MQVIINPGTGPVIGTTETDAIENIKQFIKDCEEGAGVSGIQWMRLGQLDHNGRYGFRLLYGLDQEAAHEIEMPGLPLEQVRYMQREDQNIWHFPRLYVDGSSWIWCYAILHRKENWIPGDDGYVLS